MSDDVGARLKALRTLRGISQRELAKRCGVTHSSLSLIEHGKVSPSVSSLKKILDAIPISVGNFFTMDFENTNQVFYHQHELPDIGSDTNVAIRATDSETCPPNKVRTSRSRPLASVPA